LTADRVRWRALAVAMLDFQISGIKRFMYNKSGMHKDGGPRRPGDGILYVDA